METSQKIINYLTDHGPTTNVELVDFLGITDRAVRKQLKKLTDDGILQKAGQPPKVYYLLAQNTDMIVSDNLKEFMKIDSKTQSLIEDNFLFVTASGSKYTGVDGFIRWCQERNMSITKTAALYGKTINKYQKYKTSKGLIDGTEKISSTFGASAIDWLFYVDFYSIEIFDKTKLGQMLLFSKQSQDRKLINQVAEIIKPGVINLIKEYKIDAVGFIPPTVKRELQLMKQLEARLNLNVKSISIDKIKTPVIVPQKTLNKLTDRVVNAKDTIMVRNNGTYNNILLIDDAVGSGATLNETAKKLRAKNMVKGNIIGLSITGSLKGFDVISEV